MTNDSQWPFPRARDRAFVTAAQDARVRELEQQVAQLLSACRALHGATDGLMARLIELDPSFLPSRSPYWAAVVQGADIIRKAGGA
jgi:hypothetical protein